MDQQFSQTYRRFHIIKAKVHAPIKPKRSYFLPTANIVGLADNAMTLIYGIARSWY